jgi:hypothetical protein
VATQLVQAGVLQAWREVTAGPAVKEVKHGAERVVGILFRIPQSTATEGQDATATREWQRL